MLDISFRIYYGEISVEDFKRIAETLPPDKPIIDVRDTDEAMHGMLKGANIKIDKEGKYEISKE